MSRSVGYRVPVGARRWIGPRLPSPRPTAPGGVTAAGDRLGAWWAALPRAVAWAAWISVAYLIVLLRRPATLTNAQFFAEDGQVFYLGALLHGPLASLVRPYAGYLHLLPRLVADAETAVPVALAPLLANAVALLVPVLVAAFIASDRLATVIPRRGVRWALALLLLALPNSHESLGSITFVQWYLAILLIAIAFADEPRTRWLGGIDLAAIVIAALSSPLSILLAPVYLARAWEGRRVVLTGRALAAAVPAAIQLLSIVLHTGAPALAAPGGAPSLTALVGSIGMRFIDAPFLGSVWLSVLLRIGVPGVAVGVVTIAIGILVVVMLAGLERRRRLFVLYVVCGSAALALVRVGMFLDAFAAPGMAERYVIVPGFVLAGAAVVVARGDRRIPRVAALGLIAILAAGIPADLFLLPRPDLGWRVRSACIGGPDPCVVPVGPSAAWSIRWPDGVDPAWPPAP